MRWFGSHPIVGLDIGSSSVKVVELDGGPNEWQLRRLGYAALPPETIVQGSFMNSPAIASAIREACEQAGVRSREVACSTSGHAVIVKKITLPSQSSEELEETIRWEAEQYIPFDINEVNVDYQILQEGGIDGQMDVLLVAAKRDLIDNYQTVLQDAGMSLGVMDVDAFALGNMFEANYESQPGQATAVVDIGSAFINLNVMLDGVPTFVRDITSGGNLYTEEVQKTLDLGFEEAERIKVGGVSEETSRDVVPQEVEDAMRSVSDTLVSEVQRSLDFYRATTSGASLARVVLCGGAGQVPGLARMIQERSEIPVEIADPFSRVKVVPSVDPEQVRQLAPSLCVAVGLGMRRSDDR
ncbi:MAG: type IV pilus assembly protein PilM [Myxococcota bacterium]